MWEKEHKKMLSGEPTEFDILYYAAIAKLQSKKIWII